MLKMQSNTVRVMYTYSGLAGTGIPILFIYNLVYIMWYKFSVILKFKHEYYSYVFVLYIAVRYLFHLYQFTHRKKYKL